ncbi:hypothetical protein C8J57DRAFT_1704856 [Mycena rebaudengoi]|nr:hypothetical protein C8J57DRAFT_1704856 [Mycena rebaudengoi]
MASQCFDFIREPKLLVHLMLSLAFADLKELGCNSSGCHCTNPPTVCLISQATRRASKSPEYEPLGTCFFLVHVELGITDASWFETAVVIMTEQYSNLFSSGRDMLCIDHRRRFTFGISVDNDTMRLRFFSRSDQTVSETVNFFCLN